MARFSSFTMVACGDTKAKPHFLARTGVVRTGRVVRLLCIIGLLLLSAAGCGDTQRIAIEGTVDLDGNPMDEGMIALQPLTGTASPSTGGKIKDGKFSIPVEKGGFAGEFRVEIAKYGPIPGKFQTHKVTNDKVQLKGNLLPEQYHVDSEMTAMITPDGPNTFHYDVTSE